MEVKSHSFHGHSSTTGAEINFFIPFLNEFGNSKLFELDLIFHHGTTMAVETGIYFHQHGSAVELPAGFGGMLQRQRHQYFSSLTKDE